MFSNYISIHPAKIQANMASIAITFLCICASAAFAAPYDFPENVEVDQVLQNERLTQNYVDCILDEKPCSSEGQKVKSKLNIFSFNNCPIIT